MSASYPSAGFRGFAFATCLLTWFLIGVGGLVTSHGVGMAVPDWPNTYGYNMFYFPFSQWIGGIFWEHSHRLVASLVGLMTLVLTIWSHGRCGRKMLCFILLPMSVILTALILVRVENNTFQHASVTASVGLVSLAVSFFWPRMEPASPMIRKLCWLALILVIGQGLLGGLRVTLYKDEMGIFHATLAQLFLVLMVAVTFVSSRRWYLWKPEPSEKTRAHHKFAWIMAGLCILMVAQLILGAFMRHQHAGLAVSGFPLAFDTYLWPPTDTDFINQLNVDRMDHRDFNPITSLHIQVHMLHRCLALILFFAGGVLLLWTVKHLSHRHMLGRLSILWYVLLCLQALMGIATVWSNKAADIATGHVLIGALTLALGSFMVLAARRSVYLVDNPNSRAENEMPSGVLSTLNAASVKR